jgi:OmpA-OmpF porin, OOP family
MFSNTFTRSLLLGGVAAASLSWPASAAQFDGWYISLEGGGDWVQRSNFTNHIGLLTFADRYNYKTGWAGLGEVGYAFNEHWRVELEGGYRSNDVDKFFFAGKSSKVRGSLHELTAMVNVLYDIPLTEKLSLTLGAGAGADQARLKTNNPVTGFKDDTVDFAYQGIVGVNYALGKRSQIFLDYRYLRDMSPDFKHLANTYTFDDLQKHTVTVGLRFALARDEAPPPPMVEAPPPPPAPVAAPKQFVIFFGFNKCIITAEADGVLAEAANEAKSTGAAAIAIVGHTDTSGSPKYNQKLSECRSNATAKNLVGKGIAAGSIHASGVGENDLMVQTGDGVKEPQNRRATVDLQ